MSVSTLMASCSKSGPDTSSPEHCEANSVFITRLLVGVVHPEGIDPGPSGCNGALLVYYVSDGTYTHGPSGSEEIEVCTVIGDNIPSTLLATDSFLGTNKSRQVDLEIIYQDTTYGPVPIDVNDKSIGQDVAYMVIRLDLATHDKMSVFEDVAYYDPCEGFDLGE
ncbi:MAG: hypothetical protein V3V08_03675 [Nannocystaceae bacterium]